MILCHYMMVLCHEMMILCHYMMVLCHYMMIICHYMRYFVMIWRYFVIIWSYFVITWWYFVIIWWYFVIIWWYFIIWWYGSLKFDISQVTFQNLLGQKFIISEIAKMQIVSERTVYRRMAQFSLSKYNFSSICDEVLDFTMSEIEKIFPLLSKRE